MAFWGFVIISGISFVFVLISLRGDSTSRGMYFYRNPNFINSFEEFERRPTGLDNVGSWQQGGLLGCLSFLSLWGVVAWVIYRYCTSSWYLIITLPLGVLGGMALALAWRNLVNCFSRP